MERLKKKYEKLYQMVLKIFESERMLLGKARALNKDVVSDQKKFQRFQETQKQEKVCTSDAIFPQPLTMAPCCCARLVSSADRDVL